MELFEPRVYIIDKGYKFRDATSCMMIDSITGKIQQIQGKAVHPFDFLLDTLRGEIGWIDRMVIIKIPCVKAFKINEE